MFKERTMTGYKSGIKIQFKLYKHRIVVVTCMSKFNFIAYKNIS